MTDFPPIAIVGRALVVPGAHSPEQLWESVVAGKDLVSSVPPERWGMRPEDVLCGPPEPGGASTDDRTWSDRGGYVRGFDDIFDPEDFAIPAAEIVELDPVFQWTFHTARQALRDAGYAEADAGRFGAVFGNLSFPSAGMAGFTQATAIESIGGYGNDALDAAGIETPVAANRFNSGLPALMLERALGLGSGAFALDAACASSLYAIKLACDQLHDGTSDLMLAGAVNCADDLCIHLGFAALQALSRTGQSRPFHQDADGLVPAEGCGFVALRRLADAVADGDTIHGIIRGVGLSNDGRGRGMLVPSSDGQSRAIAKAFEVSGLQPSDISLLECHATGTQVGDATEVRATADVYGNSGADGTDSAEQRLPMGSLKSNTGHLITAAGVAGLIKVVEAMRHEVRPPTLHTESPLDVIEDSPFRLLTEAEPWDRQSSPDGILRAGVSAFGFGGNNAHLLVEEPTSAAALLAEHPTERQPAEPEPGLDERADSQIAIVGIGINAASAVGREAFDQALLTKTPCLDEAGEGRMADISLKLKGLKFPPNDLKSALGQQLVLLQVADEALEDSGPLPTESTGIYVGMGTDPEAARFGVRWRLATAGQEWGCNAEWIASARDMVGPALNAAGVMGTMPNIVANRLNSQFDMAGPSFTVSAEEHSGLTAMDLAARALRSGEIDAAMVGAVDLSCDPVHEVAARNKLAPDRQTLGDAAVVLVLKRLSDAESNGDKVYAILPNIRVDSDGLAGGAVTDDADLRLGLGQHLSNSPRLNLTDLFGHAHAASGLVHVAAGALALHHRVVPGGAPLLASNPGSGSRLVDGVGPRTASIEIEAMDGTNNRSVLLAEAAKHLSPSSLAVSSLHSYSGQSAAEVLQKMEAKLADENGASAGPARLVVVATGEKQLIERLAKAKRHIENGHPPGQGVHFRSAPIEGEMAFVFTAAGAAYAGMGAELLRAMPELLSPVSANFPLGEVAGWVYDEQEVDDSTPGPSDYLWGTSLLSQAHVQLTRQVLKLKPTAAIGYSSGESNSLYAFDVWSDMDAMRREIDASGMMEHELGVNFAAIARAWGTETAQWTVWNVLAPLSEVQEAVATQDRVHVAIINTDNDVIIGGDAAGCEAVVELLGRRRCLPVGYNLACHVPEVGETFQQPWIDIHTRKVTPASGVRYYSNGVNGAYEVSEKACAAAITGQAQATLDFPATIKAAYDDGVRIFVEHGPVGACTKFISEILDGKDVLCIQLDRKDKNIEQIFEVAAALMACGVEVDHQALTARLEYGSDMADQTGEREAEAISPVLTFPAHPEPIGLPPRPATAQIGSEQYGSEQDGSPMNQRSGFSDGDANNQHNSHQHKSHQHMAPAPSLPSVSFVLDLTHSGDVTLEPRPIGAGSLDNSALPAVASVVTAPVQQSAPTAQPDPTAQPVVATAATPSMQSAEAVRGKATPAPAVDSPAAQQNDAVQQTDALQQTGAERLVQEQFAALAAMHQSFIDQQSIVHNQFLAMRTQMLHSLPTEGASVARSVSPVVANPVAPISEPATAQTVSAQTATALTSPVPPETAPETVVPVADSVPSAPTEPPSGEAETVPATEPTEPVAKSDLVVFNPTGPKWDKEQLKIHSSGKISELFGPMFEPQDQHELQCRMPEPPLLLADRVTGIEAKPGVLGKGRMWTETDVKAGDWYLNDGYMPAGFMIESGQADLMLISYMGIDLLNKGERVYRLLGCTLTYHADLPSAGETLEYEIRINGHAKHGDVRLFFFEYDCIVDGQPRLTVEDAQAGFFTYDELKDATGVLWTPEEGQADLSDDARLDPPAVVCTKSSFTSDEVAAFSEGRLLECFGPGYEWAETHTRSPSVQTGGHLFIDEVSEYDPTGGPWGRGFMRCETIVSPDDWYFQGHFKNDPCMPGNFMVEACIEALSFYLAAAGYTTKKDGWRFQPLPEQPFELKCRGEINPQSKHVTYEVHVEEVWDGPHPTVIADVVGFIDGKPGLHAHRIGVELVPDWPLTTMPELVEDSARQAPEGVVVATDSEGFPFDWKAMISCAWGRPSEAFGSMYEMFDGTRQSPRLPGEPYHFISRIISIDGDLDVCEAGMEIVCEYDIPDDVWYFDENGAETMPHAVLLEAALQPCGWVASAVGSVTKLDDDLMFRNLDGTGTILAELTRSAGVLTTKVKITSVSNAGGMVIESFEVECFLGDTKVYVMDTVFGFFPPEAFDNQVGLPIKDGDQNQLEADGGTLIDLMTRPEKYCSGSVRLAEPMLLMVDRATHIPDAGEAGLGILRGEKDVDVSEWFFKAHFFQDPVQPGSLGIEAMIQLLQFYMLDTGMADGLADGAYFEPLKVDAPLTWKYRGQVTPKNALITSTMEITEVGTDDVGPYVIGKGSLWVDGLRIYEASNMGMRIAPGKPTGPISSVQDGNSASSPKAEAVAETRSAATALTTPVIDSPAFTNNTAPGSALVLTPGSELSAKVRDFWNPFLGTPHGWAGEDIVLGLLNQYVNRVVVPEPQTLERLQGRPAIYLANHQVQIESLIATNLIPALTGLPITTMANAKHRTRWIGELIEGLEAYPGFQPFEQIVYFEQDKPESMFQIIDNIKAELAAGTRSFFVHADGTRSRSCREETQKCSSIFLDLALELNIPIVPISFTGGLPVEPITGKADVPVAHGRQDYWIGSPIEPEELRALPLRDRVDRVVSAVNELGVRPDDDAPLPGDESFSAKVAAWQEESGAHEVFASIWQTLQTGSTLDADGNVSPETGLLRSIMANKVKSVTAGSGDLADFVLSADVDEATGQWLNQMAELLLSPSWQAPAITDQAGPLTASPLTADPLANDTVQTTEVVVNKAKYPYLVDHVVNGMPVIPVVLVLEWFTRVASDMAAPAGLSVAELNDLQVLKGLTLDDFNTGDMQLNVTARVTEVNSGRAALSLDLARAGSRRLHYRCTAILSATRPAEQDVDDHSAATPDFSAGEVLSQADLYGGVLFHGPAFQVLKQLKVDATGQAMQANLNGVLGMGWHGMGWHGDNWVSDPAALDGALQMALLWTERTLGGPSLPTSIGSLRLLRPPTAGPHSITLTGQSTTKNKAVCDVVLRDSEGAVVAELSGIETHLLPGS